MKIRRIEGKETRWTYERNGVEYDLRLETCIAMAVLVIVLLVLKIGSSHYIRDDYTGYKKGKFIQVGTPHPVLEVYKDRAMLNYPNRYITIFKEDGTTVQLYSDISYGEYIDGEDFDELVEYLTSGGEIMYGLRPEKGSGTIQVRARTFSIAWWWINLRRNGGNGVVE